MPEKIEPYSYEKAREEAEEMEAKIKSGEARDYDEAEQLVERQLKPESREIPYKILGKITLIRHGHTEYTGTYPDLTELGKEQAAQSSTKLKKGIDLEKEDLFLFSSPAVRTKGTADIIKTILGYTKEVRVSKGLKGALKGSTEDAIKLMEELIGQNFSETDIKQWDRAYARDDAFEERVDIWIPRSQMEKRFFRGLEYVIRAFEKYEKEKRKIPHFVGVSHFEFLNGVVQKVFQGGEEEMDTFNLAEAVEIVLLEKSGDRRFVPLLITFRNETKEVVFDRETRTLEIAHPEDE